MRKSHLNYFLLLTSLSLPCSAQFETTATPVANISAKDGFKVELLYTVPKEKFGSWVNLCLDDKNRIVASDQFGGLYRFPAPEKGKKLDESKIEKVPAKIRAANGLLWAFGALYVAVNGERSLQADRFKRGRQARQGRETPGHGGPRRPRRTCPDSQSGQEIHLLDYR